MGKKMICILDKYFNQVKCSIQSETYSFFDAVTTTMVIAECYELTYDKTDLDELIYYNMNIIHDGIQSGFLLKNPSLFGGLVDVALSIHNLHQKTGYLNKFSEKVNILLISEVKKLISKIQENCEDLIEEYYDVISGLSGIASYLLLVDGCDDIIKNILAFMVNMSSYKNINGTSVMKWHIKSNNIDSESRKLYPNGYLNLGMAHGIAGPLVILSKSYKKGIYVEGQREAILNIVDIYKKYAYTSTKGVYWPGLISPEDSLIINNSFENIRDGWCYGSIAIARALFIAGDSIDDKEISSWAFNVIEEKAKRSIYEYNLVSPTLCHGYAGILSILTRMSSQSQLENVHVRNAITNITRQIEDMFDTTSKYGFLDVEVRNRDGENIITKDDTCKFLIGASGVILALLSSFNNSTLLDEHLLI